MWGKHEFYVVIGEQFQRTNIVATCTQGTWAIACAIQLGKANVNPFTVWETVRGRSGGIFKVDLNTGYLTKERAL